MSWFEGGCRLDSSAPALVPPELEVTPRLRAAGLRALAGKIAFVEEARQILARYGMLSAKPRRSLKIRWIIWRARFSVPALLARFEERKVVSAVAAVNGGLAILAIGVFAWVTDLPLTYPALGPTAFILFATPTAQAAAPRSIILGHFLGLASGYAVWQLVSAVAGAPVSAQIGGWPLFLSASLGLAVICALLVWLSCPHPPACASALVIALGGVTDWFSVLLMGLAVVWMTVQAVAMNRITGVPVLPWSQTAGTRPAHL